MVLYETENDTSTNIANNKLINKKNTDTKNKGVGKMKQGSCKRCSLNHTKTCQYFQESTLSNEIVSVFEHFEFYTRI